MQSAAVVKNSHNSYRPISKHIVSYGERDVTFCDITMIGKCGSTFRLYCVLVTTALL